MKTKPPYYIINDRGDDIMTFWNVAGMPATLATALKYLYRAGFKLGEPESDDLRKALECFERESLCSDIALSGYVWTTDPELQPELQMLSDDILRKIRRDGDAPPSVVNAIDLILLSVCSRRTRRATIKLLYDSKVVDALELHVGALTK